MRSLLTRTVFSSSTYSASTLPETSYLSRWCRGFLGMLGALYGEVQRAINTDHVSCRRARFQAVSLCPRALFHFHRTLHPRKEGDHAHVTEEESTREEDFSGQQRHQR